MPLSLASNSSRVSFIVTRNILRHAKCSPCILLLQQRGNKWGLNVNKWSTFSYLFNILLIICYMAFLLKLFGVREIFDLLGNNGYALCVG